MMRHRNGKAFTDRRDHYQEVTDRIVAALEAGTRPWRQPWDNGSPTAPVNGATGRRYHGINVLLLAMTSFGLGGDPRFCSYKQAGDRGWQVRKGERGTTVFFFKRMLVEDRDAPPDATDRTKAVPLLRAYTVFNGSQIDGIPAFVPPDRRELAWERPEAADVILANSGAVLRFGGDRAFYSPGQDFIQLPEPASFHTPEDFAATALHEAAHWSGSKQRLDRDLTGRFGSAAYAQEELRAELRGRQQSTDRPERHNTPIRLVFPTRADSVKSFRVLSSCFIGSVLNLPCDIPNHANYLANWAAKLKEDKREIFRAAADAQRIADYLLAFHPEYAASLEPSAGNDEEIQTDAQEAA